jgi:hypothetical protein
MTSPEPRQPLHIESQLDDHLVVLGCESCQVRQSLRTAEPLFAVAVQGFFELHAECTASIEIG